jgi:predicted RNase H-like HicB family nuclease
MAIVEGMKLELSREVDGRWIGDIPALPGVTVYGATPEEAIRKAQVLALQVMADRLEHGESLPEGLFPIEVQDQDGSAAV